MDLGIEGRVALVTAASKGLGRASANALAAEGCRLVICARREVDLRVAEDELREAGAEVLALVTDVALADAAAFLASSARDRFGGLDIVVGNIGGPMVGDPLEHSDNVVAAALDHGLHSQIRLVQAAAPMMREGGWGRICLITATGVREPLPGHALSALRAGLWGWAKSLSHDLAGSGITVNMACPGFHGTARNLERGHSMDEVVGAAGHLAGLVGDPVDFGRVVAFLCSEPARWINGMAINVDGGATMALL